MKRMDSLSPAIFFLAAASLIISFIPKPEYRVVYQPRIGLPVKINERVIPNPTPEYKDYKGIVEQLKQWNKTCPKITKMGKYGFSADGEELYYFRINASQKKRPKVLITASIHGNEPLSTSVIMAYIGNLLHQNEHNEHIKKLLNQRDIYFVPVVSPDSYPDSRHVDGVDPNRDFPGPSRPNHKSTKSVQAIQFLHKKIKPNAVISGHTSGRIYLHPYGDKTSVCPDHKEFASIVGKMGEMSKYRVIRACEMYGRPIHGSELDWYYRHGSFAIVMEFGEHQNIPSLRDTKYEFNLTFKSVLYFILKAPKVEIDEGLQDLVAKL